ncbi:MAG TPA: molybdopterin oxidoreductase, partial [Verrucomicrobiae bacterium]|nr:molybdopterin oxidoreductase [Verrucomicrobiae bacterium]
MTKLPPTSRPPSEKPRTLIDDLLAEQQELTAVEKFSRAHDQHAVRGELYRDLLPATPPAPGQQYAFEVDLDKCTGCKAC